VEPTQPAEAKEDKVVEPLAATVNRELPVEEETIKTGVVVLPPELIPWTASMAVGEEELKPDNPPLNRAA